MPPWRSAMRLSGNSIAAFGALAGFAVIAIVADRAPRGF